MSDVALPFALSRVVLIDGRSGSGKTTLAAQISADLSAVDATAQTLHLDSLYPGWDGLARGSAAVVTALREGGYHPYNWHAGQFMERWISLDSSRPLVIEGCGALTAANLAAARAWASTVGTSEVRAIWLECEESLRRERALARDGETFAPHWERWAAQEEEHYAEHEPWLLASETCNRREAVNLRFESSHAIEASAMPRR